MSLNAISTSASTALPTVNFHPHGHRKGAHVDSGGNTASSSASTEASSIGQLPVGASTALFGNLLQSLEQTVGAQSAAASGGGAGTTSAVASTSPAGAAGAAVAGVSTAGQQQELQAFMHSLFQALKQDGLNSSAGASASGAPAVSAAAVASGSATATGQYQGNLVSSLQSLIQQLSPDGKATAATSTLNATFQNLVNGVNGAGAATSSSAAGTASGGSSEAALQNFLNNFLQNLQANGVHSLTGVGNSVNANI
jgi:hypothetical protein